MSEFLDMIESLQQSDASVKRLFGSEGRGLRAAPPTEQMERMTEAIEFFADIKSGRRSFWQLREALSTSDFPLMFGFILDKVLLANYQHTVPTYRNYVKIGSVSDFRTVYRFAVNGAEGVLTQLGELVEYPETTLSEARYTYSVAKYGKRLSFSWETLINDQLGAFDDIPARFAVSARNTEEKFVTQLFVDANGPHASFYTSGNKNIVNTANSGGSSGNNPPLTIAALQDAFTVLSKQVDADGNPIVINAVRLVVPPALKVPAMNILSSLQLWVTAPSAGGGGPLTTATTGGQQLVTSNWMTNVVELDVNPFIPVVAGTNGNTSWFLFADANVGRPALEVGFLRGHDAPEMFMKEPDAIRIGGGAVGPTDGDFNTDSIVYKIRHVLGGTRLDPKMTVASNGSGS